jgi:hypothetical protein
MNRYDIAMGRAPERSIKKSVPKLPPVIKVKYDGGYPNLCSGNLSITVNGKTWKFPSRCLSSGGNAWVNGHDEGIEEGDWTIQEWPTEFPENLKKAVTNAVNDQVPHGCCGGCIRRGRP